MTLAAQLLRAGDSPLSAIAARVGYANQYAFSKAFRRELGVAPSMRQRRGPTASR
jgi:AraC-like DNA-binding protein